MEGTGQLLDGLDARARLQHGVAHTFQVAQVFEARTVLQNMQLATQAALGLQVVSAFKSLDRRALEAAIGLLDQTGLRALESQDALSLSYGAKKRLELAMALAAEPGLLLLDEPAAGLAAQERSSLM